MSIHRYYIYRLVPIALLVALSGFSYAKELPVCFESAGGVGKLNHRAYFLLSRSGTPWVPSTGVQSQLYLHSEINYFAANTETKNNRPNVAPPKRASLKTLSIQSMTKNTVISYLKVLLFPNETGGTIVPETCGLFNNEGMVRLSVKVEPVIIGKNFAFECKFTLNAKVASEFSRIKNVKILTKSEKQPYQQSYWWEHPATETLKQIQNSLLKISKSVQSGACRPNETEQLVCLSAAHASKKELDNILAKHGKNIATLQAAETEIREALKELEEYKEDKAMRGLRERARSELTRVIQSKQNAEKEQLTVSLMARKNNEKFQKTCSELNDDPWKTSPKNIKRQKKNMLDLFPNK